MTINLLITCLRLESRTALRGCEKRNAAGDVGYSKSAPLAHSVQIVRKSGVAHFWNAGRHLAHLTKCLTAKHRRMVQVKRYLDARGESRPAGRHFVAPYHCGHMIHDLRNHYISSGNGRDMHKRGSRLSASHDGARARGDCRRPDGKGKRAGGPSHTVKLSCRTASAA